MNRTITMNLSGIIFHIEEDAYENLNHYLVTIKGYFKNSESQDEIMHDIEARIAEMLQEKVSQTKQAVLMVDVDSVIQIMGKPEDYVEGAETSENTNTTAEKENTKEQTHKKKRLFRNPDDKIFGGVCSGIGNYFDFDPMWLRGAFAISFFVFGTGFLLYIILLIIIPKAKTTAEKLEMRGEKIDINNIGKTVNEEFQDLKSKMKEFGNDVTSNKNKERMKHSAERASDFVSDLFRNIFSVFGKIFSVTLIIIGVIFLAALLAFIFGADLIHLNSNDYSSSYSFYDLSDIMLPDNLSIELAMIGIILFLGVPIVALIYSGIRCLFNIKYKNKIVSYTSTFLWLGGLGILIYVGVKTSSNFLVDATNKQTTILQKPKSDILYLSINKKSKYGINDNTYEEYDSQKYYGNFIILKKDKETIKFGCPELDIKQSENDSIELVVIKTALGNAKKEATNNIKNIKYLFYQTDSLIAFDPYFYLNSNDKFRDQQVNLILKLPVNQTIYLDKSIEKLIFNIDNVSNTYDGDMIKRRWMMTKEGLRCVDCEGLKDYNGIPVSPVKLEK